MAVFPVLCRVLAAAAFLLTAVSVSHAAGVALDQTSPRSEVRSAAETDAPFVFAPGSPPEVCRDCEGLRYFSPSATPSGARTGTRSAVATQREGQPDAAPGTQPNVEFGRAHLSADRRVNMARTFVQLNRFAEALKILRTLAPDHPDQTDVLFLLGLAASRGSQERDIDDEQRVALLDEAIAAFRSILIRRPGLVRVRLELALAFFLKEEDDLALNHFERVLVGKPPPPVLAKVRSFLNVMRARRRWNAYFGFSIAPDTNITAATDAQFIYIEGLRFRLNQRQVSSGIGIVGWGGGEYQFPLADRWRLRAGVNVNHREYKGGRFDQTFLGGYVGPRWLLTRNTEMSLLASATQRWWGGSSLSYDVGTRLEVEHRVFAGLRLSGRASWQDRTNQQQKFLEGPLMVFSLGARYVLFPTVQVNALVGYQQQDAQAEDWANAGYWTRVGTNVALPWGFTVGASAEFRWTNYEGSSTHVPDLSARRDQTRILGVTLLNRAITVYGFSPQVAFSNQVRESNASRFDFKRNLVEMRWVRQF